MYIYNSIESIAQSPQSGECGLQIVNLCTVRNELKLSFSLKCPHCSHVSYAHAILNANIRMLNGHVVAVYMIYMQL